MSTSSDVSLGSLRQQAKFRADLENNPSVSDAEWNGYITNSVKELRDILISAYGNEYSVATTYQFNVGSSQLYPLPDGTPAFMNTSGAIAAKFYKLLGVDIQYSSSPNGWVTLKRFEFIERNKATFPNVAVNYIPYSNLRYRIEGNNLMFMPVPQSGQLMQVWYIPAPSSLQYTVPCATTLSSTSVTTSDVTGFSNGMNVYGSGIQSNTTITGINSTTATITLSKLATATLPSSIISFWNDAKTIDGIAGWEEYVIIDAAIKAQIKQESDIQPLLLQKQAMKERIEAMAEGRDVGQAQHVSDVLGANAFGFDNDGFGDGSGGGYSGW